MRSLLRDIAFIAQNATCAFLLYVLLFVCSGILPSLRVVAISFIVSGAEQLINEISFIETTLLQGIVLFSISIVIQRMILLGQMPISSILQYQIKNRIDRLVVEKALSLPYKNIENSVFQTTLDGVRRFSNSIPDVLLYVLSVLQAVISLLLLSIQLREFDWLIYLIALAQIPRIFTLLRVSNKQHRLELQQRDGRRLQDYYAGLSTNGRFVKEKMLFGLGDFFLRRWIRQNEKLNREQLEFMMQQIRLELTSNTFILIVFSFGVIVIVLYPDMNAVRFVALIAILKSILDTFDLLVISLFHLRSQMMNNQEVFDFLESEASCDLRKHILDEPIQTITFQNVTFTYAGCLKPALQNISIELHAGESIAIIGENGAGKTTFIKLLLGLYEPDSGYILCNGKDIRTLDRDSYYQHISVVLQKYNKYPLSVMQNINLFAKKDDPPNSRIIYAAQKSGANTYIEKLPFGYKTQLTNISENGIELSGGQWQRLAIARGIFKKAELLIMDEPTASMDPLLEVKVLMELLNKDSVAIKSVLKLIVSHRVGIASKVDRILVLQNGRLEESGTHEELMKSNGYYARVYSVQAEWYKEQNGDSK